MVGSTLAGALMPAYGKEFVAAVRLMLHSINFRDCRIRLRREITFRGYEGSSRGDRNDFRAIETLTP